MAVEQRDRERARRRLNEYRVANSRLRYLEDRIESLEAKVTQSGRLPDAHAGWTGRYWGRSKYGKGWMYSDDPDELVNPRKELKIPRVKSGTRDPKAGETLIVELIDQQFEYERKALEALDLCLAIEAEIDEACVGVSAVALKYRYLEELTYPQISERMNYSVSQVRRLVDEGLTQYSEKMTRFSRNGTPNCDKL
jgi:hypothetical protein